MFQFRDFGKSKLFIDDRNRTIYYKHAVKTAYIIPPQDTAKFKAFYYRYFVSIIFFILANNFILPFPYSLIAAIALLILMEWYFQNKLTANYNLIKNYDITKQNTGRILKEEPKSKTITRLVLYLLFAILIIANAYVEQYELTWLIGSYVLAIFALFRCWQMARILMRK